MVDLYVSPSCTSCRKAKQWLEQHNIPYKERNIISDPLNREEIIKGHLAGKSGRQIAREVGWSDVSVNRIIREWKQKQGA